MGAAAEKDRTPNDDYMMITKSDVTCNTDLLQEVSTSLANAIYIDMIKLISDRWNYFPFRILLSCTF